MGKKRIKFNLFCKMFASTQHRLNLVYKTRFSCQGKKKILSKIYVRLNLFYVQARAYDSGKALGKKFALEFVKLYKNQLL